MLLLVLDTSSPQVLSALVRLGPAGTAPQVVDVCAPTDARRHGELLAIGIEAVLHRWQARPDAVVVGTGPGPFTGLRVGLVSAAVFADVLAVPVYGVCSLDAVARSGRACVVLADARRREVYWARYDATGARVDGPAVARPAVLADALRMPGVPGAPLLCGAGAVLHADVLVGLPVETSEPFPRPAALAACAAERALAAAPSEPLTPRYLRRPDATPPGGPKRVGARTPA